MEENIQNCCRICLDVETKHVSILEDSLIHLQVKSCLPINVALNDNLPKSVCVSCVSQLNDFYNFQLNARCSQDWLESSIQKISKNTSEIKPLIQPLPDSEYNSDSLLEFLNNTANIEEYLNNLGREDIPCIVNMIDKTESSDIKLTNNKDRKLPTPKKKSDFNVQQINMDIDVLDSDIAIVKELLLKETEPKKLTSEKTCFGCKVKFDNVQKLSQHISVCDIAFRTCIQCDKLFDSRVKMHQHSICHSQICDPIVSQDKDLNVINNNKMSTLGLIYSCKQCGDVFKTYIELYKHVKQHLAKSDEKVCDICGHKFFGDDSLSKHRLVEHEKSQKVFYRCKICSFTAEDRKQIYTHVLRHTQLKEPNRHLCESCGQSFVTQATLLRHSQQHGVKFYKCKICNKKFTDSRLHEKHLIEHVEMVMCDRCGKNISSLDLDKHRCD